MCESKYEGLNYRRFEIVKNDKGLDIEIPRRETSKSAGYD